MQRSIKVFSSPYEVAEKFAEEMAEIINESVKNGHVFSIALSGGSTPELLFSLIGDHFSKTVPWKNVHIFWVDERCVSPDDPESNFGMANKKFISKINIPVNNIHRIKGEEEPVSEALRYSKDISESVPYRDGLPVFDLIILGLGDDGHTASIFPGNLNLLTSEKICDVAVHPFTHQRRITLTGRIINNSQRVVFLVTGKKKATVIDNVINNKESEKSYPASFIDPVYGELTWYIDKEAAVLL